MGELLLNQNIFGYFEKRNINVQSQNVHIKCCNSIFNIFSSMINSEEFLSELHHDREEEEDIYRAVYPRDVVRFLNKKKFVTEVVDRLVNNSEGMTTQIVVRHLDDDQRGSNSEGYLFWIKWGPDVPRAKADLHEMMFVNFTGSWGNQNIGGWIEKIDRSDPRGVKIPINPVVIDEVHRNVPKDQSGSIKKTKTSKWLLGGELSRHCIYLRVSPAISAT